MSDDPAADYFATLDAGLPPLDLTREERVLDQLLGRSHDVDILLHAHLIIEQKLIRLLERTGVSDDVDSSFPVRNRLARDLGLISDARFRTLFVVNRVRNKFAARADYKLVRDDVAAVARHLDRNAIREAIGTASTPAAQMRALLAFVYRHLGDEDVA